MCGKHAKICKQKNESAARSLAGRDTNARIEIIVRSHHIILIASAFVSGALRIAHQNELPIA